MTSLPAMLEKARYFPVSPRPLKMVAGLHRFGADFGQGERDRRYFQIDGERARYLAAKRAAPLERHVVAGDDDAAEHARAAALGWMRATLAREAPEVLTHSEREHDARDPFDALARNLQEDFSVVVRGDDHAGRTVLVDIRFPSGFRPEQLANAAFEGIHEPVPGFPGSPEAARSMVRTMIERGPFVRFVWTLRPDDALDHHPDVPRERRWERAERLFFRVERQVTIPLTEADASLFLIRTYVYDALELAPEQRAQLLQALATMPSELRAYKSLPDATLVAELLERSAAAKPPAP